MRAGIASKVVGAAVGTLAIELADLALDKAGLSKENAQVARVIARAGVSAATTLLLQAIFEASATSPSVKSSLVIDKT